MEKTMLLNPSIKNHHCKSPLLFTIPLNVYSDEVEKERDRETFIKIQKLTKKCQQLRERLHSYAIEHTARIEKTRNLVQKTIEFNDKLHGKKIEFHGLTVSR